MRNTILYVRGVIAGLLADLNSHPPARKFMQLRGSVVNYHKAGAITPWANQLRDCLVVLNCLEQEMKKRNAPVLQPALLSKIGHPDMGDKHKVKKQIRSRHETSSSPARPV